MDPLSFPVLPQLDGAQHTDAQLKLWEYSEEFNLWSPLIITTDPVLDHNSLTLIDGGAPGGYFHLTSQEYTDLQDLLLSGGGGGALARRHAWLPLPGISYDYCGTAPEGSLTSTSVWTVTRISISDAGTVTATEVATPIAWDDYLYATYV